MPFSAGSDGQRAPQKHAKQSANAPAMHLHRPSSPFPRFVHLPPPVSMLPMQNPFFTTVQYSSTFLCWSFCLTLQVATRNILAVCFPLQDVWRPASLHPLLPHSGRVQVRHHRPVPPPVQAPADARVPEQGAQPAVPCRAPPAPNPPPQSPTPVTLPLRPHGPFPCCAPGPPLVGRVPLAPQGRLHRPAQRRLRRVRGAVCGRRQEDTNGGPGGGQLVRVLLRFGSPCMTPALPSRD